MRIAQIAPLLLPVPPKRYGGTERVVSTLTDALADRGHDVTLFASGDSRTKGQLSPIVPVSLKDDPSMTDPMPYTFIELERMLDRARDFDVIHNHQDYLVFPFARRTQAPVVTTLHTRLDRPDLVAIFREYSELPIVSISNAQREPLPWAHWVATVYNGIDLAPYPFTPHHGTYLAFLGRISPEKGVEAAIAIARKAAIPLRLAAKIDDADRDYYEVNIRPLIDGHQVEYVGEISDAQKATFLGNAYALIFPIAWPEPFGLAMVEAMACGTPVLATRMGSVPEVIVDGMTGFISDTPEALVARVGEVTKLNRLHCRERVERCFNAATMVDRYEEIYQRLAETAR